ncbi:hypothetical protein Ancab_012839 [Ancistrocladus abbreviatus]
MVDAASSFGNIEKLNNEEYNNCSSHVYFHVEKCGYSFSSQLDNRGHARNKNGLEKTSKSNFASSKGKLTKKSKGSTNLDNEKKLRQPTIFDALKKAGVVGSKEVPSDAPTSHPMNGGTSQSAEHHQCADEEQSLVDVGGVATLLEPQRSKFRPLSVDCLLILTFVKNQSPCCPDPGAELPLHSFLLHDLHYKLDRFSPVSKQNKARCLSTAHGTSRMEVDALLSNLKPFLPSLRKHFDAAISILKGTETCQEHWKEQSLMAGHRELTEITILSSSISFLVVKETLSFFSKVISLPETQMSKSFMFGLLEAFQPVDKPDNIISGFQPVPLSGTIEYSYCGAYSFLENVLEMGTTCAFSFKLASEVLLTLEAVVFAIQNFPSDSPEKSGRITERSSIQGLLPTLQKRLGTSAWKLLRHNWDNSNLENGWKSQGETIGKILHIYLDNSDSTPDALDELACSILPQVSTGRMVGEDDCLGFPTLTSVTIFVWYRTLHEQNFTTFNKLVRDICFPEKPRAGIEPEIVEHHLNKLWQCVNIAVSLVNLCRIYDKVTVRAMAVKYGGKFIDSFLKVFDFLQIHYGKYGEQIVQLVKELQKATRTIQTLCSEAKGSKQTVITSKIPATKRSMERFLFHVKALLHTASGGCTFWMGNLKHKDLSGQVVSSQAYLNDQGDNDADSREADTEDRPHIVPAEEQEVE